MLLVRFLDAQTLFFFFWLEFFFFFFWTCVDLCSPQTRNLNAWLAEKYSRTCGCWEVFHLVISLTSFRDGKKRDFFLFGFFSCAESRLQCWRLRLPGPLIAERVFTFDTKIMDCWTTKLPMDYALYFEQMTKINNISFRHW